MGPRWLHRVRAYGRGLVVRGSARSRDLAAALEQLGHTRAFANAIFESVDVGLVLLGKDGEYLAMNRRHEDFMALAFPAGAHRQGRPARGRLRRGRRAPPGPARDAEPARRPW